jgi:hypothetical protein
VFWIVVNAMGKKKNKSKKKERRKDFDVPVHEDDFKVPEDSPAVLAESESDSEFRSNSETASKTVAEKSPEPDQGAEGASGIRASADSAAWSETDPLNEAQRRSEAAEQRTRYLTDRYLDTLEGQLRAKDQQLHALNERLGDAFDMQRALALLIKAYEKRTGLLAEAVWDDVSEDALDKSPATAQAKAQSADDPSPQAQSTSRSKPSSPEQAPSAHADDGQSVPKPRDPAAASHSGKGVAAGSFDRGRSAEELVRGEGAFTQWLRQTGAKAARTDDA